MRYVSTRGGMKPVKFRDAVIIGLAPDGGLIVPESVPDVSRKLHQWSGLSYPELAFEIIRLYADIPDRDLEPLVKSSYANFDDPATAPVREISNIHILELFHGPTLSFKDIALQLLGNLFEYVLSEREERLNILAATSGDTGSAAIEGVRGRDRISIFVMHPKGGISPLQEHQMTTVIDDNVFNIAVAGSFDDCQEIMKGIFADNEFKRRFALGSVNSVNWARIVAQIVYYFHAYFRVREVSGCDQIQFSVPTGNFGDILAGYYAGMMGLPIRKLVLGTNENDILARFFNSGEYRRGQVSNTLSPAMDIQVASNFERYIYYKLGEDACAVTSVMRDFAAGQPISIPLDDTGVVDQKISAARVDKATTLATIRRFHEENGYVLDPHTAVGVSAANAMADGSCPVVSIATAHPAKFSDAIEEAIGEVVTHPTLESLKGMDTRCHDLPAKESEVRSFIESKLRSLNPRNHARSTRTESPSTTT